MGSPQGAARGAGALSGILGVAVIVVSAVLLAQSLGYRSELGYIFGYQLPNIGPGSGYYNNRNNYSFFGYELDPLIGIGSGGVVIGLLQLISCFFLCCGRRSLSIGWALFQLLLLIGVVICFALSIYFEVYSYRSIPGYGYLGLGGGRAGLGLDYNGGSYINPGFVNNQYSQQQLYQNQALLYNQQVGLNGNNYRGSYANRYYGDYVCNPTGQAFVGVFGIDMVVIIIAMVMVGISSRQTSDEYVRASTPPRMDVRYKA